MKRFLFVGMALTFCFSFFFLGIKTAETVPIGSTTPIHVAETVPIGSDIVKIIA